MRQYRIAFFHNLVSGGAKRSVYEYARALRARGHEIDLFTLNAREEEFLSLRGIAGRVVERPFSPLLSLGDHTFLLSPIRRLELRRLAAASRSIAAEIEEGRYDVAFVHSSRFVQCPLVMRYLRRTPKIYYCHETLRFLTEAHPGLESLRDRFRGLLLLLLRGNLSSMAALEREEIRRADRILTNSRFTRRNLWDAYGLDSTVCYQGVDTEKFRPLGLGRGEGVLSVGQLSRWKSQAFLVEALASIPESERPPLVLVYDKANDNYLRRLLRRAEETGVALRMERSIPEEELVRLYNRASIFVYAPIREPFGFVPLEAMACGTPVVVVPEGGVEEAVGPKSGALFSPRDPVEFGRRVRELLRSEARRDAAGREGRAYVLSRWSWERAAVRLESCIESLLSSPAAGGGGGRSAAVV